MNLLTKLGEVLMIIALFDHRLRVPRFQNAFPTGMGGAIDFRTLLTLNIFFLISVQILFFVSATETY